MKKKLLLVEDEVLIAMELANTLKKHDFEVVTVHKGKKAIEMIDHETGIDLILLDIDLGSGIDGAEAAIRILKKHDLPIIFLTNHGDKETIDKVRGITRYGYVMKDSAEFVLVESINIASDLFEAKRKIVLEKEKLRQREKEFSAIYEHSPVAMILVDQDKKIRKANAFAGEFAESLAGNMIGKRGGEALRCLNHLNDPAGCGYGAACHKCGLRRIVTETFSNEDRCLKSEVSLPFLKNGEELQLTFLVSTSILHLNEEPFVLVAIEDITGRKKLESDLRRSEETFRSISEYAPIMIDSYDESGRCTLWNKECEKTLGYTFDEMQAHQDPLSLLYPNPQARAAVFAAMEKKDGLFKPSNCHAKDGSLHENLWATLELPNGRIVGIGVDVTERNRTEQYIQAQNEFLNSVINSLTHPFYVVDPDTYRIRLANTAAKNLGVIGDATTCHELMHHTQIPCGLKPGGEACPVERVKKTGAPASVEHAHIDKEGNLRNKKIYAYPLFDEGGKIDQIIVYNLDITEQKVVENALLSAQQRVLCHVNQTPLAVIEWNTAAEVVQWNPAAEKIFGYSEKEAIGRHAMELIVPESARLQFEKIWRALLNQKSGERSTDENITKQGDVIYCEWYNTLLVDDKGEAMGVTSLAHNITDRIQAERKLRLTQYSIDNSSNAAFWIKQNGQIRYANKAACLLTGYSHQELIRMYIWDLVFRYTRDVFSTHWQELEEKRTLTFESIYLGRDGRQVPIEVNTNLQEFEKEKYIFAYVSDRTEREKSKIEQTRLVSAIEQTSESVIITDLDGNIEYVNPAFERSTGYSRTEVLGENPRIIKSGKHGKGFFQNLWETINRGEIWSGNIVNKRKDGQLLEESATIFPVLNSTGAIENFVAVKRDITEQNKIEKHLRQSQKLEAIGTLSSGIAHDFNNILAAIFGYTQLSKSRLPDASALQNVDGYLDKILSAGNRAKDLIDQILTLSREGSHNPKNMDLRPLLKESIDFLRATLPSTITIKLSIDQDLKQIYGDATQIQQVIINLCTNASHAMDDKGGPLVVALSNCQIKLKTIDTGNLDPGDYVLLTVTDIGKGMTEEIKQRIFEPFYTTKDKGKGTGLGLSVVHGIVSKHGGAIKVESQVGFGTKFKVYFPISTDDAVQAEIVSEPGLTTGSETILLADDEIDLCEIYEEMLNMQGYVVQTTNSSRDALNRFKENPDRYQLVICDYTMPEMSGLDLSREIKMLRPNVPIILLSGVERLISDDDLKTTGIVAKYSKPVEMGTLIKGVRDALDKNNVG